MQAGSSSGRSSCSLTVTQELRPFISPVTADVPSSTADTLPEGRVGDHVTIIHGRPISKRKHFTLRSIDFRPELEHIPAAPEIERISRRANGIMEQMRREKAKLDAAKAAEAEAEAKTTAQ